MRKTGWFSIRLKNVFKCLRVCFKSWEPDSCACLTDVCLTDVYPYLGDTKAGLIQRLAEHWDRSVSKFIRAGETELFPQSLHVGHRGQKTGMGSSWVLSNNAV